MADFDDLHSLASRVSVAETTNARHALETALSAISSARFLYQSGTKENAYALAPASLSLPEDLELPDVPITVPLGKTAFSRVPTSLPVVAFVIQTDNLDELSAAFTTFLVENNAKPFCRPVFLLNNLNLLPFLGHIGTAYCAVPFPLRNQDKSYLNKKYGISSYVDFVSGKIVEPD